MTRLRAAGRLAWPPLFVALAILAPVAAGCRDTSPSRATSDTTDTALPRTPIAEVIRLRTPELMRIPGVVGLAEARLPDGSPCLRVYITERTPELDRALPKTIDGWPVDIEVSGPFRALDDSSEGAAGGPR